MPRFLEMIIEKAIQSDQADLLDLLLKQFEEHEIHCPADTLEAAISEMLRRQDLGIFLISRAGNKAIGFAAVSFAWTLEHGGKSAWLDELYVLPECRGAGIGAMMIDRVLEEAQNAGCLAVDLEVEEEHRRAEHLYQRKGFQALQRTRWVKILATG